VKAEARDAIIEIFCRSNNIEVKNLDENLKLVTSETFAPFLLFMECLQTQQFRDRSNAIDGYFINMIHRSANTFGSMVSLISSGHLQDAEVISRTLSESALTIQFLLKGDPVDNLSNYLASYYVGQKWKNDKWDASFGKKDIHPHKKLIVEKNTTERSTKEICKQFIESVGGQWPNKPKAANMSIIFKRLDKDVEHRTVYRAMCGQSHQNPEDLINSFLYSLVEDLTVESKMKAEKHSFSIFMCLWGMKYFLEALASLGHYYNFTSVESQSKVSLDVIKNNHLNINHALKECYFPKGWVKFVIDGI